jgi:hypothetical protein
MLSTEMMSVLAVGCGWTSRTLPLVVRGFWVVSVPSEERVNDRRVGDLKLLDGVMFYEVRG